MNRPKFVPHWVGELAPGRTLRCVGCRATAQDLASPNALSIPEALSRIKQAPRYSHAIPILGGGEPLYRKHLVAAPG